MSNSDAYNVDTDKWNFILYAHQNQWKATDVSATSMTSVSNLILSFQHCCQAPSENP